MEEARGAENGRGKVGRPGWEEAIAASVEQENIGGSGAGSGAAWKRGDRDQGPAQLCSAHALLPYLIVRSRPISIYPSRRNVSSLPSRMSSSSYLLERVGHRSSAATTGSSIHTGDDKSFIVTWSPTRAGESSSGAFSTLSCVDPCLIHPL